MTDPDQSKFIGWSVRFNILNAIGRGLLYLHQDSILRIIHRDLKASNIRTGQILFDRPNPPSPLHPLTVGRIKPGQTGHAGQLFRLLLDLHGRFRLNEINPWWPRSDR
jgi:serine/threonine protein kinase